MKKAMIIGFIAALALALPAWAADGYTDVPATHWAAESITACSAEGILGGYPDGAFRPDVTLNVGEYLKMLCCSAAPAYRFYNVAADPAFGGHWAHPYYTRLCELLGGVLPLQTDASALAAYLDRPITRLEMARLSAAAYARVVEGTAPASQKDPGFTDVASLSAEDREVLAYCAEKNILGGFPDNTFRPSETLTRAQAAKVSALIYTSQWETRGVALRKMLGAEGGPLALALEKSYALSVERGEGLSDSACAELLQCLTEYCAKLPVQLPRNLGFCLSRLEEALPLSAPIPNQTSFSACIQSFNLKFSAHVLPVIIDNHYPDLLSACGLTGEDDLYLYFLLTNPEVVSGADGKLTLGDWQSKLLFERVQQGDAEEQDKQTLSKCELMYQILQGVLHIPEQEMEKLRFFPEDYTFSKVLDVSAYYR